MQDLREEMARLATLVANAAVPVPAAKESIGVTVEEAMVIARKNSKSAFYRWAKLNRVKPYSAGLYRRADVENGMARAAWVDLKNMEGAA